MIYLFFKSEIYPPTVDFQLISIIRTKPLQSKLVFHNAKTLAFCLKIADAKGKIFKA